MLWMCGQAVRNRVPESSCLSARVARWDVSKAQQQPRFTVSFQIPGGQRGQRQLTLARPLRDGDIILVPAKVCQEMHSTALQLDAKPVCKDIAESLCQSR